jgi:hypothetical protein
MVSMNFFAHPALAAEAGPSRFAQNRRVTYSSEVPVSKAKPHLFLRGTLKASDIPTISFVSQPAGRFTD